MTDCQTESVSSLSTQAPLVLRPKGSESNIESLPLAGAKTTIGAGQSCTHRLDQPGVRPLHCLITQGPSGMTIRRWSDGTLLNGEVFSEASLSLGDWLTIGPVELEVTEYEEPAAEVFDENPGEFSTDLGTLPTLAEDELALQLSAAREDVFRSRAHGRRRAERLVGELRAARNEDQAARDQVEELRAEISDLEGRRTWLEGELAGAQQKITNLQETLRQADEQAASALEEVNQQIAERNERITQLQAELERQQAELNRLVEAVESSEESIVANAALAESEAQAEFDAAPESEFDVEPPVDESVVEKNVEVSEEHQAGDLWQEEALEQETIALEAAPDDQSPASESNTEELNEEAFPEQATANEPASLDAEEAPHAEADSPWDIEAKAAPTNEWKSEAPAEDTDLSSEAAEAFGEFTSSAEPAEPTASVTEEELTREDHSTPDEESVDSSYRSVWSEPDGQPSQEETQEDGVAAATEIPVEEPEAVVATEEAIDDGPDPTEADAEVDAEEDAEEDLWGAEPTEATPEHTADETDDTDETSNELADVTTPVEEAAADTTEETAPATSAFDLPEPIVQKPEAPVSFIEKYSHMLPEDDETELAAPVDTAPVAIIEPMAEPNVEENSGNEESMEDYMAQMMARLRGDEAPAPQAAPKPVETPVADPTPAASLPVAEPKVKPVPLTSLDELKTGPAPEHATDMSALRDLANDSARQAIKVAGTKQDRETAYTHLALCAMAGGFGGYAVFASGGSLNAPLFGGLAVITIGAYWAFRTVGWMFIPKGKKEKASPKPAKTELPISG